MTIRKIIVYSILAVAAIAFCCYMNGDRAKIRRVFASIEKMAAKEQGEAVIEGAMKSQALSRHFASRCRVKAPEFGFEAFYTREEISGGMLAMRSYAKTVKVEFDDLEISVEGDMAQVEGVADFSGTDTKWRVREPTRERFRAGLQKTDGAWLVREVVSLGR